MRILLQVLHQVLLSAVQAFLWAGRTIFFPNSLIRSFVNDSFFSASRLTSCTAFSWTSRKIAIADLLSQKKSVGSFCLWPMSSRILLIQIAWQADAEAATYSASADDWATVCCFLEAHENTPEPNENAYPEVLFISSADPAQSLSV